MPSDVNGSLVSTYQSPFVNLAYTMHPGLIWKAEYNFYGYGEGGPPARNSASTTPPFRPAPPAAPCRLYLAVRCRIPRCRRARRFTGSPRRATSMPTTWFWECTTSSDRGTCGSTIEIRNEKKEESAMKIRAGMMFVAMLAATGLIPVVAQGPGADTYKAKCQSCHGAKARRIPESRR